VIGDGTLLASGVQILSGQHQHARETSGSSFQAGKFVRVSIGPDSWIGASATVMADLGSRTTAGAGPVVTRPIPDDCAAVGNPARVIRGAGSVEATTHVEPAES
jgi:maltose O-acetyltransferase